MYAREEDILNAIHRQLKDYVNEHYITDSVYRQRIQELTSQIADLTQRKTAAWIIAMEHYERYVQGKISKEEFRMVQDVANQAKEDLIQVTESKYDYEKQYVVFRKLLSASSKDIPLSQIMDWINKVVVDDGRKIVVDWNQFQIELVGNIYGTLTKVMTKVLDCINKITVDKGKKIMVIWNI